MDTDGPVRSTSAAEPPEGTAHTEPGGSTAPTEPADGSAAAETADTGATEAAERTDRTDPDAPHILIVGGGIAGLTAALHLARCKYRVTVVEKKKMLGGNLASREVSGQNLDVYPHMYQAWYENFWALMKEVGVDRTANFRSFSSVCQAQPKVDGKAQLARLTRPYSAAHLVENLFSGVAPPADMFLFGYASLDLMAEIRNPTLKLENVSLTGYLSSRVYMTQTALEAYEAFVLRVWGIPAYMISAADCQAYARYCYATADEDGYLSVGPAQDNVIGPIVDKLNEYTTTDGKPAVTILRCFEVTRIALEKQPSGGHRVTEVDWKRSPDPLPLHKPPPPPGGPVQPFTARIDRAAAEPREESLFFAPGVPAPVYGPDEEGEKETRKDFDSVVLAVPPSALSTLARRRALHKTCRIVDAIPDLAELDRVGSAPIPVVHLYLEDELELGDDLRDPVALNGSKLSLAFTDISMNWTGLKDEPGTVLALSCSEPLPLVGPDWWDNGFAMIKELSRYLPFEVGDRWYEGDCIDWDRTTYDANADAQLSLNSVGSDRWRPCTFYPDRVENLFFAGDYCQHDYGITTIEGAVATGVKAAAAVQEHRKTLGRPIQARKVKLLPPEVFVGMRYGWLTSALAAMGWSRLTTPSEVAERAREDIDKASGDPFELLMKGSTLRYLLTPGLPAKGDPRPDA